MKKLKSINECGYIGKKDLDPLKETKLMFRDFLVASWNELAPEAADKVNLKQVNDFINGWVDHHFGDKEDKDEQ